MSKCLLMCVFRCVYQLVYTLTSPNDAFCVRCLATLRGFLGLLCLRQLYCINHVAAYWGKLAVRHSKYTGNIKFEVIELKQSDSWNVYFLETWQ